MSNNGPPPPPGFAGIALNTKTSPELLARLAAAERAYDVALGRIPFEHRGGFVIRAVIAWPGRTL